MPTFNFTLNESTQSLAMSVNSSAYALSSSYANSASFALTTDYAAVVGSTISASYATVANSVSGLSTRLGLTTQAKTNIGSTNSVYLSIRTDSISGSGTKDDPFDASTQPKFDALMSNFPTGTTIYLLPGTFLTGGISMNSCKIYGSGMGITIVQLSVVVGSNKHAHLFMSGDYGEIHDMTFDGNYAGLSWPAHDAVGGIILSGTNTIVQNVEVKNCYGDSTNGQEQFSILLAQSQTTSETSARAINCYCHSYTGNYTNGIALGTHIEGCNIDGANHGLGIDTGIVTGCVTTNCGVGFYQDTGPIQDVVIKNNKFHVVDSGIPIQFNNSGYAIQNITIDGNLLSGGTSNAISINGGAGGFILPFNITNNIYTTYASGGSGLLLQNNGGYKGIYIDGNIHTADGSNNVIAGNYVGNNHKTIHSSGGTGVSSSGWFNSSYTALQFLGASGGWYRIATIPSPEGYMPIVGSLDLAFQTNTGRNAFTLQLSQDSYYAGGNNILNYIAGTGGGIDQIRFGTLGFDLYLDVHFISGSTSSEARISGDLMRRFRPCFEFTLNPSTGSIQFTTQAMPVLANTMGGIDSVSTENITMVGVGASLNRVYYIRDQSDNTVIDIPDRVLNSQTAAVVRFSDGSSADTGTLLTLDHSINRATINGNLGVQKVYDASALKAIDVNARTIFDNSETAAINFGTNASADTTTILTIDTNIDQVTVNGNIASQKIYDTTPLKAMDIAGRMLFDNSETAAINFGTNSSADTTTVLTVDTNILQVSVNGTLAATGVTSNNLGINGGYFSANSSEIDLVVPVYFGVSTTPATATNGTSGNLLMTDGNGSNITFSNSPPANSSATGTTGMIATDSNYIYVCTSANVWKRIGLSSW